MNRLKGKVAIVTGAGRGIGRAEALALAAEGAKLVVNDLGGTDEGRDPSKGPAEEVASEIRKLGGQAITNCDSVADPQGCRNIIRTAVENFGRLDVLVNNAGIHIMKMVYEMSDDDWDRVIKTHLYGTFYLTREACILFRQQNSGRIINTSSESGQGWARQSNYSAAKEGIIGLTKTVAREMSQHGVTCNAIRPRAYTRMSSSPEWDAKIETLRGKEDAESRQMLQNFEGLKQLDPRDVAQFVVYLASDEATSTSGCVFIVGGKEITLQKTIPVGSMWAEEKWTVDSIARVFPQTLGKGLAKPELNTPPG